MHTSNKPVTKNLYIHVMPNIGVKPGLCLKEAALDFRLVVKAAETIKLITERGFIEKSSCITGQ